MSGRFACKESIHFELLGWCCCRGWFRLTRDQTVSRIDVGVEHERHSVQTASCQPARLVADHLLTRRLRSSGHLPVACLWSRSEDCWSIVCSSCLSHLYHQTLLLLHSDFVWLVCLNRSWSEACWGGWNSTGLSWRQGPLSWLPLGFRCSLRHQTLSCLWVSCAAHQLVFRDSNMGRSKNDSGFDCFSSIEAAC